MLKYFLWMSKFSRGAQWAILLGGYFGNRMLGAVARNNPDWAPWILPVQIIYIVFALMTWLAYPFFNLLLRLNKFGRLVLSEEQTVASNWFGACLLLALGGLVACGIMGFVDPWALVAMVFGFLLLPVSSVFKCQTGWPRNAMAALTIILVCLGTGSILAHFASPKTSDMLIGLFIIGIIATTWIANVLMAQRPRY